MPFTNRPYRRFPVQCAVTYNVGPFLKLPLAYFSGFWSLITLLMLGSGPVYAELVLVSGDNQGKMGIRGSKYHSPQSRCGGDVGIVGLQGSTSFGKRLVFV